MTNGPAKSSGPGFWREWGPPIACVLLTGAGLYLLIALGAPLASALLLAVALVCPLAALLMWWLYRNRT